MATPTINVEKCVEYLRSIGVDIDTATAGSWMDSQVAHRFLTRTMKQVVRRVTWCQCSAGHVTPVETKHGQRRKGVEKPVCRECGGALIYASGVYAKLRDGTVHDRRDAADRWKDPMDVESDTAL